MPCVIGITCGWQEEESRHTLRDDCVRAVCAAGGLPFLLPSTAPELAAEYYACIDGLIFSGGDDPDPLYYGEEPCGGMGEITPHRDSFELALAGHALTGKKPVLAICRGLQIINIAAGGTLHQDLRTISALKHSQKAPRWYATHRIRLVAGSKLQALLHKEEVRVNSFHHQGVNMPGAKLRPAAVSADGLIEALEHEDDARYFLGIQWHPESLRDKDGSASLLMKSFVAASSGFCR